MRLIPPLFQVMCGQPWFLPSPRIQCSVHFTRLWHSMQCTWPNECQNRSSGARFSKNLTTNLRKTYEKVRFTKNLAWACDYEKILQKCYEILRTKLCKTYDKLTITLQVSPRKIHGDFIWETLCQRLSLVEYFELKITDNQNDDFLRMLSKMSYHFPLKKFRKSYLADLQDLRKSYDELRKNLMKFQKSGPCTWL